MTPYYPSLSLTFFLGYGDTITKDGFHLSDSGDLFSSFSQVAVMTSTSQESLLLALCCKRLLDIPLVRMGGTLPQPGHLRLSVICQLAETCQPLGCYADQFRLLT